MVEKWIQKAFRGHKKGSLHKQLDVSQDRKIGKKLLRKIVGTPLHEGKKVHGHLVTRLMKARANAALNAQKRR